MWMMFSLHGRDRPGLNPVLDVWNISNSLNQVGKLGETFEDTFVREITDVHEGMEVSPGEVVSNKELSTTAGQLCLQLSESCWNCHLGMLLLTSFIFGEEQFHPGVDEVLDDINDLIHLCGLHAGVARKTNLTSHKSCTGHGLADDLIIPLE